MMSVVSRTGCPSNETITSPGRTPAFSAGEPSATLWITGASSLPGSRTPIRPRVPPPRDRDHFLPLPARAFPVVDDALGHRLLPEHLDPEEGVEHPPGGEVTPVHRLHRGPLVGIRLADFGEFRTEVLGNVVQPRLAHLLLELLGRVEGDDVDPVFLREQEDVPVIAEVGAPVVEPFCRFQEL